MEGTTMNYLREQYRNGQAMRRKAIDEWEDKGMFGPKCPEPIPDLPSDEWFEEQARIRKQESREAIYGFERSKAQSEAVRADTERRIASGELVLLKLHPTVKDPSKKNWLTRRKEARSEALCRNLVPIQA